MKATNRAGIGLAVGCALSGLAFVLAGVGHGTYAPMAFNASVVPFLPGIGMPLSLLLGPVLWATYYRRIPAINDSRLRHWGIVLVVGFHLVPCVAMAVVDRASGRAFRGMDRWLLLHAGVATGALAGLTVLSLSHGSKRA